MIRKLKYLIKNWNCLIEARHDWTDEEIYAKVEFLKAEPGLMFRCKKCRVPLFVRQSDWGKRFEHSEP